VRRQFSIRCTQSLVSISSRFVATITAPSLPIEETNKEYSQQGDPSSKCIAHRVHSTDDQGSLFRIPSANFICPSINHRGNRICRSTQEESEILQPNRHVPNSKHHSSKDVQTSCERNEKDLGIIRIRDNSPDDGADNSYGRNGGGDCIDRFDGVTGGFQPQGKTAVGSNAICLTEKDGENDEDPEMPARQDTFDNREIELGARLTSISLHTILCQLDFFLAQEAGGWVFWSTRQKYDPKDSDWDGCCET